MPEPFVPPHKAHQHLSRNGEQRSLYRAVILAAFVLVGCRSVRAPTEPPATPAPIATVEPTATAEPTREPATIQPGPAIEPEPIDCENIEEDDGEACAEDPDVGSYDSPEE